MTKLTHDIETTREFVKREIHGNASQLIRYFADDPEALAGSEYSYELDLLPILARPDWSSIEVYCDSIEIESSIALEHWIVSPSLAASLIDLGEMAGELFGLHIWGRQTSGQAIYMDNVIQTIACTDIKIRQEMNDIDLDMELPF